MNVAARLITTAMQLFAFLSLVACSSSGGNPPAPSTGGSDPAEVSGRPGDCKQFIAKLPTDYFHDWLSVPEDPNQVGSPEIKVFYYGKITDRKNVIAFFNGGPASDSHGNHIIFENEMKARGLSGKYSFVYIDQRGTGCSSNYPQGDSSQIIQRLRFYGSTGIVNDAESIRKKLIGPAQWKIFGQSYGAFIVHRYVSLFPQSISKAYAHANTINADPIERLKFRISSQARVFDLYFQKYPDDRVRMKRLRELFIPEVCVTTKQSGKYCGVEILQGFIVRLGFSNRWEALHSWITAFLTNANGLNSKTLTAFTPTLDNSDFTTGVASGVIGYYDRNVAPMNSEICKIVYELLEKQGLKTSDLTLDECSNTQQSYAPGRYRQYIVDTLASEQDLLTMDAFKRGLEKMAPHSFYLYSGERDCFVPKESFSEEFNAVGSMLIYRHFATSGHEGYRTEAQVWTDLAL